MTFPIKKRINTELFIDRSARAFQKGDKETDRSRKYLTSQQRVELKWREKLMHE